MTGWFPVPLKIPFESVYNATPLLESERVRDLLDEGHHLRLAAAAVRLRHDPQEVVAGSVPVGVRSIAGRAPPLPSSSK